jgi:hypothetical protein
MADLRIDLAAEFRGKKAFKEADKATTSLDKAVGKLGKQLASVFAASKIYAYGKASVRAFAEDEKAALSLARTVKNLGLEFGTQGVAVNNYISNLEQQTGVLDDELRPALDRLLRSTLSITKAQELLNLALDIAAGTGKSVTQVSQSLQKAYLGQTQALGRLGVGLSKAELTSSSFEKIQKRLTYLFAGQAKDAANSYAGQIDRLAIASNNAKETIGKGLVDALLLASGKDNDVQDVADAMNSLATYTADAIRGIGVLAAKLQSIDKIGTGGLLGKLLSANFKFGLIGQLASLGARNTGEGTGQGGSTIDNYRASAAAKAAEAKRVKELAALQKKQIAGQKALTAEQKKQAALKKAGSIFDLEQIQLIAALKGKLSDEDRKRVELQFALLVGNTSEAQKLTYELAKAQGLGEKLAGYLASLPQAANPFASWEAYLDRIMEKARAAAGASLSVGTGQGASVIDNYIASIPKSNVAPLPITSDIARLAAPMSSGSSTIGDYLNVTLQIDGKTIASALQDTSMSGTGSSINRLTGGWKL